ncbi:MAG TPA: hypothetical protein DDW87_00635 [Firmicutes bacterium]|nr:hypothetical protein [Bacillota bacterium]
MHYINMEQQEAMAKMRTLRNTLRPAERGIADLILSDPRRVTTGKGEIEGNVSAERAKELLVESDDNLRIALE